MSLYQHQRSSRSRPPPSTTAIRRSHRRHPEGQVVGPDLHAGPPSPSQFAFAPTEVEDAAANYAEFQKMTPRSPSSPPTASRTRCGTKLPAAVGKAPVRWSATRPIVDPAFGVHIEEEGLALRGTFVINPEGVIKTAEVHSNERSPVTVSETLRKLKRPRSSPPPTPARSARPGGRKARRDDRPSL